MLASATVGANANDAIIKHHVHDSISKLSDPDSDADKCLAGFQWQPASFDMTVDRTETLPLIRFPSPLPTGNAINDQVAVQWYVARDAEGNILHRPAIVVVHESGSNMNVGRMFAQALSLYGVHAFLIHLPNYGHRRSEASKLAQHQPVALIRQAVADVRRSRDVIATLPEVNAKHISLQGTSLGGFVVALVGSLDDAYKNVFVTLAGADFYGVLTKGQKDAAKMRQRLEDAGFTGDKLKELVYQVEPLRIAHRLQPESTWLFSGATDQVVPIASANALASAAKIQPDHHVIVQAGHYTAIAYFPFIIDRIVRESLPTDQMPASLKQ